jgi:hypothetical protein
MKGWIIEADIYRLKKALVDAGEAEHAKLALHLRRAEARLLAVKRQEAIG